MSRTALATATTLAVAGLTSWPPHPNNPFIWGLPVLVISGSVIWSRLHLLGYKTIHLPTLIGMLLALPAVADRLQSDEIARFDIAHTVTADQVDALMLHAHRASEQTPTLLVAAAAAVFILSGRAAIPSTLGMLASAAAAFAATDAIIGARDLLAAGQALAASEKCRVVSWSGIAIAPFFGLGFLFPSIRKSGWSSIFLTLTGAFSIWAATSPLGSLAAAMPKPSSEATLPVGPPSATSPSTAAPTTPMDLAAHLSAQGRYHAKKTEWACHDGPRRWAIRTRNSAALPLDGHTGMVHLDALSEVLRQWSTQRLALVGHAPDAPSGPLQELLSWPIVPLLLDRPPHGAAGVLVTRAGASALREPIASGTACVLIPDPDITVDHLWHAGRTLLAPHGPCDGLSLLPARHRAVVRADPSTLEVLTCPAGRAEKQRAPDTP